MPSRYESPSNYTLIKTQRNEVFTQIRNANLNPQDFELIDHPSETGNYITVARHKPTQYLFIFDTDLGGYIGHRTPGNQTRVEKRDCLSWSRLLLFFAEWL